MHRTLFQNQFECSQHQQRVWQEVEQRRLARIGREQERRWWVNLLLHILHALSR